MIRYHARWILPISRAPLIDACVAVDGERIAYVGSARQAPAGDDVDLGDAILLPGLVNAHTHLELTAFRGLLEDLPFRDWILSLQAAKQEVMTPDDFLESARLGVSEGLLAGITTYADSCDSGVALRAMRELGVRGIMYREVFGPSPSQCAASLAGLREKIDAMRPDETPLQRLGVSPHAPYTVSDALFSAVTQYARDHALPMAIHVAESDVEHRLVRDAAGPFADGLRARGIDIRPRGRSAIEMLGRLAVLDAKPLLIHCVQIDDADIAAIAHASCPVAHCPISNSKLGHGISPVIEMIDAGITVGLGTDSMASNNHMDLLAEARVAALAQRARLRRHDALSASRALELATLGSARALGLDAEIGSLDPGKSADLVAFELDEYRATPTFDPVTSLIFSHSPRRVRLALVAGHPVVRDGSVINATPSTLPHIANLSNRLTAWRQTRP